MHEYLTVLTIYCKSCPFGDFSQAAFEEQSLQTGHNEKIAAEIGFSQRIETLLKELFRAFFILLEAEKLKV